MFVLSYQAKFKFQKLIVLRLIFLSQYDSTYVIMNGLIHIL